jgi:uncharacterized phage protein (TIGR02220 family)
MDDEQCYRVFGVLTYRQIKIEIWQDSFFLGLDLRDKAFFLYMLSNTKTTQCGVYELSMAIMMFELKLPEDQIVEMIQKFSVWGKIVHDPGTNEFLIVNWMKHNQTDNPKMITCIQREILNIKSKPLLDFWKKYASTQNTKNIPYPYPIHTLYITDTSPIHNLYIGNPNRIEVNLNNKEEKEKNKEEIEKEEKENFSDGLFLQNLLKTSRERKEPIKEPAKEPTKEPAQELLPHELIIEHLNLVAGTKYQAMHGDNRARIEKLTKEGYTLLDFFTVIDKKAKEWMGTDYERHLCPGTLFSDKFEKYLNQNILAKAQAPGSYGGSSRRDASFFDNLHFLEEE